MSLLSELHRFQDSPDHVALGGGPADRSPGRATAIALVAGTSNVASRTRPAAHLVDVGLVEVVRRLVKYMATSRSRESMADIRWSVAGSSTLPWPGR